MISKPMLATAMKDPHDIQYPVLASPKLDGIRCLTHPGLGPVSRTFKPIPNNYVRWALSSVSLQYLDGELITVNPDGKVRTFNQIQSDIMSEDGTPDFRFVVFDSFRQPGMPFIARLDDARSIVFNWDGPRAYILEHTYVQSAAGLIQLDSEHVAAGYEGTMTRSLSGLYKQGRSTLKQEWLLKLKQFSDAEGVVIGVQEKMHNANEAKKDDVGHTKRSTTTAGLVPTGTLGALVLHTEWGEVSVGTGFNDKDRKGLWDGRAALVGRTVTFKYQTPPQGVEQDIKPRFPVFKGFRYPGDL